MSRVRQSRRHFLKSAGTLAAAGTVMPYWFTSATSLADDANKSPNARLRLGCIGTGDRWRAVGPAAMKFADCLAVCDADANHMAEGQETSRNRNASNGSKANVDVYEDYRKILDRKDIDIVTIVTPDHWHSKIAIEALQAGKDVYCEKPLTLTINEGKQIEKVLSGTDRIFQVGTQQRTEMGRRFLGAIALIRAGRIGEIKKVTCDIGGSPASGEIPVHAVPDGLNWELWLGQAPKVDYRWKSTQTTDANGNVKEGRPQTRCHYEYRWWYEYSGGKLTDWGAHHVDIATWAIGMEKSGPKSLEGLMVEHPMPFKDGHPTEDNRYNCATKFDIQVMYPNGVEMRIVSHSEQGNGILFEGTKGSFFVSRGDMRDVAGTTVIADLKTNPLPEGAIAEVYGKPVPESHMANFIQCVRDREMPISDVYTHNRMMDTCHLSNIAIRLGRKIEWDAEKRQIVGDDAANQWLGREQRKGYEIDVPV